jgi:glucose-6-phosphate 1-epimerase
VFPQFGPIGKLPQHGFARVSNWKWMGITKETDSLLTGSFSLDPDSIPKAQKELWNYKFYLIYNVTLENNKLITELVIKNTCIESFEFTTLLQ